MKREYSFKMAGDFPNGNIFECSWPYPQGKFPYGNFTLYSTLQAI